MIAYCPDPMMLAAAEALPAARGLVAVALHNGPLLEWVATFAPQHLGGEALPGPPKTTAPARPAEALQPSP
ncbi:hypothetical protein [Kocuria arenosa]|uniref:hypothetical protein n=1 Tax=Kocuria arenosa TaxID=3071446 RepID=UPI0034D6380D